MVGDGVAASRVGERVWTWNAQWKRASGTSAEYVVLPAAMAVRLPGHTSVEEGACLGIPAMTAYHAVAVAEAWAGSTILVSGGAGAVAHYAIQFAKARGEAAVGAITRLLEEKRLINNVALTFPLDDIVAAHEAVEQGKPMGNVVVRI